MWLRNRRIAGNKVLFRRQQLRLQTRNIENPRGNGKLFIFYQEVTIPRDANRLPT